MPARSAVLRRALKDRPAAAAACVFVALVLLAVIGPLLWRHDPNAISIGHGPASPSWSAPMGTDEVGRDVFARFNQGARISLGIGILVVVVGAALGGAIGVMTGALSGWTDQVAMRAMDAILAFPPLVLAMAVTVGLGPSLKSAAVGITLTSIPYYARIVRAEVIRLRSSGFLEGAVALGATRSRVILRHIVPNALSSLPILAAANFSYVVLTLAALGFVGLGAQIPTPEWGAMITEGQQYSLTGAWWIGFFPGLGVLMAVAATGFLADRARDLLDPRGTVQRVPKALRRR